jgi:hypothetical protein
VTAVFPCTVHGNEEKRLPDSKKFEISVVKKKSIALVHDDAKLKEKKNK